MIPPAGRIQAAPPADPGQRPALRPGRCRSSPSTTKRTGPATSTTSAAAPSWTADCAASGAATGTGRASGSQRAQRRGAGEREQRQPAVGAVQQHRRHVAGLVVREPGVVVLHLAEHRDDRHQQPGALERRQRVGVRRRGRAARRPARRPAPAAPTRRRRRTRGRGSRGSRWGRARARAHSRPAPPAQSAASRSEGRLADLHVWDAGGVDDAAWAALTLSLTVAGAIWTWFAFRRRGLASGDAGARRSRCCRSRRTSPRRCRCSPRS